MSPLPEVEERVTPVVDLTTSPEGPARPGSKVCDKKEGSRKIQNMKYRSPGPQIDQYWRKELEPAMFTITELFLKAVLT